MLSLLAFLLTIGLGTATGWLVVRAVEGSCPVLRPLERILWGSIVGPTLITLATLVLHVLSRRFMPGFPLRLDLIGFLLPMILIAGGAGLVCFKKGWTTWNPASPALSQSPPLKRFVRWLLIALLTWTAVKLAAGTYDLLFVPTFWDDSFNNWNMRGKVFYLAKEFIVDFATGNGSLQTSTGISSYPAAVPLIKTWLATMRGAWSEPLINGIHAYWYLLLLGAFFFTLRRSLSVGFSLFGVYALASLPLLMIHGFNPYAEVFLAMHLFLSVSCLWHASRADTTAEVRSWLKLWGLVTGALLFTKNEATILYLPLLLLLCAWVLWQKRRQGVLAGKEFVRLISASAAIALCIALPWLIFKWVNGLAFGNAKQVSGIALQYNPLVVYAIRYQLLKEPDFLLLPLLLPTVILLSGKRAWRLPLGLLTVFVLAIFVLQSLLFIFVQELATEAIRQTGLSRGIAQFAPVAMLLVMLLVSEFFRKDHSA